MKFTLSDLWKPSGTVDRGAYALVGFIGFAIKHNIDRAIATMFDRHFGLFSYWMPIREVKGITSFRSPDALFVETLLLVALPFIWIGVALTVKRLRSIGLPAMFAVLFFVPFLNLLFLLLLCLLPSRTSAHTEREPRRARHPSLSRIFPKSAPGSAAVAVLMTLPLAVAITVLGAHLFVNYGWGVFIATPFTCGLLAAAIHGIREPRSLGSSVAVACLSVAIAALALLAVAVEGVICLLMAAPIALPLAVLGGILGYQVQRCWWFRESAPAFLAVLVIFSPGLQWMEHVASPTPPTFVVTSFVDIQAPPEAVWRQVVAFSEIPAPREYLFRAGIAYPIRAEIQGTGVGAERHCVFSTGAFVEPIQIWDEPRLLKFSVTSNPPPMEEWTPYSHIDPPHLHGFLISNGGQFLLTPLPNGGTRLEGTTWYHHGLWPASYWRLWSDAIIHRIHMRVLEHIRQQVEQSMHPAPPISARLP